MLNDNDLRRIVKQARDGAVPRKFSQSAEITLLLKDIDVKRGFSLNEVVVLPYTPTRQASICVVGTGDTGTRAQKANVDRILQPEELDRLGTNKREARKVVKEHDFFLADAALMATVGRAFGQFLGPKGKMPTPMPYGAPIEAIADRMRKSVRIRAKNQLNASAKIGDEKMDDSQLTANASAVLAAVEKKLPQGDKNIRDVLVKFTMGKAAKLPAAVREKDKRRTE
jgi:large subunit ribosomal protein L1